MMSRQVHVAARVWMALIVATAASFTLAEKRLAGEMTVGAIMLIAAFKARLVFLHFMELESTTPPWRAIFEIWIVVCTVVIWGCYAYGSH